MRVIRKFHRSLARLENHQVSLYLCADQVRPDLKIDVVSHPRFSVSFVAFFVFL